MRVNQIETLFSIKGESVAWKAETLGLLCLPEGKGKLLFTTDLGEYTMPVATKYAAFARIELYLLLPAYWNSELGDPLFEWALETLVSIKNYLKQGRWAIHGHTFSLKNVPEGRVKAAGFDALLLTEPISLALLEKPLASDHGPIYFRALIPIVKREKEAKEAKGVKKLMQRFADHGVNEKLDEFRGSVVKSRLLFWRK